MSTIGKSNVLRRKLTEKERLVVMRDRVHAMIGALPADIERLCNDPDENVRFEAQSLKDTIEVVAQSLSGSSITL